MGVVGLAFPTDIRWERVCHSEDMDDRSPCDQTGPAKWQSSMAVFRYVPEEEYQHYEGRRLVYYKITCTISSYQPRADEVQGSVKGAGTLSVTEENELDRKLKSYAPCNGAILQVTVAPTESNLDPANFPYVLDVQPKQRALYEQVTDSSELASRSLENLNIRKGGGTTESQEVLDIDRGSSFSAQAQGQYAGAGGGLGFSYTKNIEQGTRSIGQEDASRVETTDSTREAREVLSHTTQLTQMYTLLQSYHVGTNRVMFFVSPRPHVLEEPTGFIRGPRRIDGVQDFFLIVSQDEGQELPCLSARLDTGHLTVLPIYDYDRSKPARDLYVSAFAGPPNEQDPTKVGVGSGDLNYDCFDSQPDIKTDSATAESGYVVESVEDVGATELNRGSADYQISGDRRSVTLTGRAAGHACYRNGVGDALNTALIVQIGSTVGGPIGTIGGLIAAGTGSDIIPEQKDEDSGFARRRVRVNWRSETPTKKIGERQTLLITTRVLCCCEEPSTPQKIVEIVPLEIEKVLGFVHPNVSAWLGRTEPEPNDTGRRADRGARFGGAAPERGLTAREANDLEAFLVAETARVAASVENPASAPARDTELAMTRATEVALEIPRFRRALTRRVETIDGLGAAGEKRLTEIALPGSPPGDMPNRLAVVATPSPALAEELGVDPDDAARLRLAALGFGNAPRGIGAKRRAKSKAS